LILGFIYVSLTTKVAYGTPLRGDDKADDPPYPGGGTLASRGSLLAYFRLGELASHFNLN